MILKPNSIILPDMLRNQFVVTVNEYPARGFPVGHIDISFFDHGQFQGTFGRNSIGTDVSGKDHKSGSVTFPTLSMPGGVFTEGNANAMAHFVVVGGENYHSMYAFAQSQAEATIKNKMDYNFLSANCADFAYQVFSHSTPPLKYRNIHQYLKNHHEPVAIYAEEEGSVYSKGSAKWGPGRRMVEHGLVIARLIGDVNAIDIAQRALH